MTIKPRPPRNPSTKMTLKQQRFVEEFFKDPSSARVAAIKAGYSNKTSRMVGPGLLKHPLVREALEELHTIRKQRLGVTEDRVLLELSRIAFANLGDIVKEDEHGNLKVDWSTLTPDQTAALSEVQKGRFGTKIKNNDKLAALVHIGKHIGMFREKLEVTGKLSLEQLVLESFNKKEEESPV